MNTTASVWNNSTSADPGVVEGQDESELPPWVVGLDNAATLLMTSNTVTLMLGMGAATYWKEFWPHLKRPWACLIGLACQFALLPAVGFGLVMAFHLPPYEALGVLILACSPGGAFSNFFTYWVNGDLALSIIMTALSAIMALGAMPLNLWVYAGPWTNEDALVVPYFNILISLLFVTIPVLIGMIIRHFTRRWAGYISKVCGVLGWMGAIACGVLLVLRYWNTLIYASLDILLTAALLPLAGVIIAYILTKIFCFSHKICRTVAIETGCQNMVVATSIMLLSFTNPKIRGQMVMFPVLYGLCQLAEVAVAVAIFQIWFYVHRNDVTEEEVTSVLDNTILTSVPVPAHKLSQAQVELMMRNTMEGDLPPTLTAPPPPYSPRYEDYNEAQERDALMSSLTSDTVDPGSHITHTHSQHHQGASSPPHTPLPYPQRTLSLHTPQSYPKQKDQDSPNSPEFNIDLSLDPQQIIESACSYDSDGPVSPTLSNKGVPNMFPVTETDFPGDRGESPIPYGSPVTAYRNWKRIDSGRRNNRGDHDNRPVISPTSSNKHFSISTQKSLDKKTPPFSPTSPVQHYTSPAQQPTPISPTSPFQRYKSPTHKLISRTSPTPKSISPTHQSTSPSDSSNIPDGNSPAFNFYHQDIRVGQARQFSTFGRKHE